jgi:hypothetical protein
MISSEEAHFLRNDRGISHTSTIQFPCELGFPPFPCGLDERPMRCPGKNTEALNEKLQREIPLPP